MQSAGSASGSTGMNSADMRRGLFLNIKGSDNIFHLQETARQWQTDHRLCEVFVSQNDFFSAPVMQQFFQNLAVVLSTEDISSTESRDDSDSTEAALTEELSQTLNRLLLLRASAASRMRWAYNLPHNLRPHLTSLRLDGNRPSLLEQLVSSRIKSTPNVEKRWKEACVLMATSRSMSIYHSLDDYNIPVWGRKCITVRRIHADNDLFIHSLIISTSERTIHVLSVHQ